MPPRSKMDGVGVDVKQVNQGRVGPHKHLKNSSFVERKNDGASRTNAATKQKEEWSKNGAKPSPKRTTGQSKKVKSKHQRGENKLKKGGTI